MSLQNIKEFLKIVKLYFQNRLKPLRMVQKYYDISIDEYLALSPRQRCKLIEEIACKERKRKIKERERQNKELDKQSEALFSEIKQRKRDENI
ncbi:hypothetical protein AVBRAN9333_08535 [Campylobacter sp. RM9333]|uniref:hypothetical protein n=1 Tax=Campylobacter sp. RM9333 TaxID=2735731 RepID=UPI001DF0415B|nr:hypothetical protein [Campylobacter sp. RM9333]